jgi:hydroxypyruvate isomerase
MTAPSATSPTAGLEVAVNIEMWFEGDFVSRIRQAARLGFGHIEIWTWRDKDLEAGAAELREHGMSLTQFTAWGFGEEVNHPDFPIDAFVCGIAECCEAASRLPGCDLMTVVAGNNIKGLSKAEMHAAIIAKLRAAVPVLESHGKTVILEPMNPFNHPGHCLYGSADGIAICEAVGSEFVKLNWDLFHMRRCGEDLVASLEAGWPHVGYIQFADSPGRNEPGTGDIDFGAVFAAVKRLGYLRPLGAECLPLGGDVERAGRRVLGERSGR